MSLLHDFKWDQSNILEEIAKGGNELYWLRHLLRATPNPAKGYTTSSFSGKTGPTETEARKSVRVGGEELEYFKSSPTGYPLMRKDNTKTFTENEPYNISHVFDKYDAYPYIIMLKMKYLFDYFIGYSLLMRASDHFNTDRVSNHETAIYKMTLASLECGYGLYRDDGKFKIGESMSSLNSVLVKFVEDVVNGVLSKNKKINNLINIDRGLVDMNSYDYYHPFVFTKTSISSMEKICDRAHKATSAIIATISPDFDYNALRTTSLRDIEASFADIFNKMREQGVEYTISYPNTPASGANANNQGLGMIYKIDKDANVENVVRENAESMFDRLKSIVWNKKTAGVVAGTTALVAGYFNVPGAKEIANKGFEMLVGGGAGEGIGETMVSGFEAARGAGEALGGRVTSGFEAARGAGEALSGRVTSGFEAARGAGEALSGRVTSGLEIFYGAASTVTSGIERASSAIGGREGYITAGLGIAKTIVTDPYVGTALALSGAAFTTYQALKLLTGKSFRETASGIATNLKEYTEDTVTAIYAGIFNTGVSIRSSLFDVVSTVTSGFGALTSYVSNTWFSRSRFMSLQSYILKYNFSNMRYGSIGRTISNVTSSGSPFVRKDYDGTLKLYYIAFNTKYTETDTSLPTGDQVDKEIKKLFDNLASKSSVEQEGIDDRGKQLLNSIEFRKKELIDLRGGADIVKSEVTKEVDGRVKNIIEQKFHKTTKDFDIFEALTNINDDLIDRINKIKEKKRGGASFYNVRAYPFFNERYLLYDTGLVFDESLPKILFHKAYKPLIDKQSEYSSSVKSKSSDAKSFEDYFSDLLGIPNETLRIIIADKDDGELTIPNNAKNLSNKEIEAIMNYYLDNKFAPIQK